MINVRAYNSQTIYLNTQENVYQTGWKEKTIDKVIRVYLLKKNLFVYIFNSVTYLLSNVIYSNNKYK